MTKISLNHITKIEGHASLIIGVEDGKVTKCELGSVEGARYFEGIVRGKHYSDIREITSKICGICSVAHTMASLKAVENAFGIQTSEQTELLREMIAIGERIRSHATHLYLLVLPDYLGFESGIAMASKYKDEVLMALDLVKLGNNIVSTFGGKEMHPFTSVVGGFTYVPPKDKLNALLERLKAAKPACLKTMELFAGLKHPDFERKTEYLAMKPEKGFSLHYGNIITSTGVNAPEYDYKQFISEYIVTHSHCKFVTHQDKSYSAGALARLNLMHDLLDNECKELMKKYNIVFPSYNPFHQTTAQAIELVHWTNRAIQMLNEIDFNFEGLPEVHPKAGRGVGMVEAPRGMVLHDYTFDDKGICTECNIIAPTTQFLRNLEEDIKEYLPSILHLEKDQIVLEIEKLIRAYDPCFSCGTHFLDVTWE